MGAHLPIGIVNALLHISSGVFGAVVVITIQQRQAQNVHKKELRDQEVRESQNSLTTMQAEKATTRNMSNTTPSTLRWASNIIDSLYSSTTSVSTPSPTTSN
jgi:cytoskeletal protein RodZ